MTPPTPAPSSPWWFRLVAVAAAAPLLSAVLVTASVFQDDQVVHSTTGIPATTTLRLQDRWHAVQTFGQAGWPAVLTALGCLALALVVVRGRPGGLAPPEGRTVVTWLAVGCGVWALGTAVLTSWFEVVGSTGPDQSVSGIAPRDTGLVFPQWAVQTGQEVLAAAVAAAAVLWCGRPPAPTDQDTPPDGDSAPDVESTA
ncbi:hypothetical protein AB1207_02890 [Kineococcus endophyticus]|uniref:DUF2567 domain-containing protein n=1 Tax=Kineococcus endophyticus TaxID=1181883 RepID=A0ABV3P352_9ACTN